MNHTRNHIEEIATVEAYEYLFGNDMEILRHSDFVNGLIKKSRILKSKYNINTKISIRARDSTLSYDMTFEGNPFTFTPKKLEIALTSFLDIRKGHGSFYYKSINIEPVICTDCSGEMHNFPIYIGLEHKLRKVYKCKNKGENNAREVKKELTNTLNCIEEGCNTDGVKIMNNKEFDNLRKLLGYIK